MMRDLDKLWASLIAVTAASGQQSYRRRYPGDEAFGKLGLIRDEVAVISANESDDGQALLLLSEVCECMLDYDAAERYLVSYLALTGNSGRKHLKRLALLRSCSTLWKTLILKPRDMERLRSYIDHALNPAKVGCDFDLCRNWLSENGYPVDEALDGFRCLGAYNDFQVAAEIP